MLESFCESIEQDIGDQEIGMTIIKPFLFRMSLVSGVNSLLQYSYAKRFKGMSEQEIDNTLKSFAFKNCIQNTGLLDVFKKHLK